MLGKTYDTQSCSIARSLEIIGERWSLLIVRDALFAGLTRFSDFQRSLGIATNVLDARLAAFVEAGIMRRQQYGDQPELAEYLLTPMGRDLLPSLLALSDWGDRWASPGDVPIVYRHAECGTPVHAEARCEHGDSVTDAADLKIETGAGMSESRIEVMAAIFASRARDPRLHNAER